MSSQLKLALVQMAAIRHVSVGYLVEEMLWHGLGKQAARRGARFTERLRHTNALISEVIVEGLGGIQIAGTLSGATKPGNIHTAEVRQERRNRLSEKCQAALDEVYELAQNEDLARRNRTRAEFYILLSQLAHVNEMILRDASEEEILAEIQKLQEGQERFKEVIQKLEEAKQAKESDL